MVDIYRNNWCPEYEGHEPRGGIRVPGWSLGKICALPPSQLGIWRCPLGEVIDMGFPWADAT